MKIKDLKIGYTKTQSVVDNIPKFSWELISDKGDVVQNAYRIQVRTDDRQCVLWDSKKQLSDQSIYVEYEGNNLEPFSTYEVQVWVCDNYGEEDTAIASFETGIMDEDNLSGEMITSVVEPEEVKIFGKKIIIKEGLKYAKVYATAYGVYEVYVNGDKAGDAYMAPGWTSYHNRVQYQTYDVTNLCKIGDNEIEYFLGNGWYAGYLNGSGEHHLYGAKTAIKAMFRLEYENGKIEIYGTDDTYDVYTGSIVSSDIYKGEKQDYLRETKNLGKAVLLQNVSEERNKSVEIVAQQCEPIRITKRTVPVEKIITTKNELVIDFGQNMAGFVEVKLPELKYVEDIERGITIYHCEALDEDGNFFNETYRTADSIDTYIYGEDMVGKTVAPHFTYHGFRYIKVEGLKNDVDAKCFVACTLHTDMVQTAHMTTSSAKINQLISNIEWGQRSNFFDIPTDCPQRDERLGWTGDAMIFSATAMTNFDVAAFFKKWLRDVSIESNENMGVPQIVPNIVAGSIGTSVWSDCATVIPWNLYNAYGDVEVLREQYANMKLWVDWIYKSCGGRTLWMNGFQRGDWLALDSDESLHLMSGGTDKNLVANVFYAYSTKIVRDSAQVLAKGTDRAKYDGRYKKLVKAISEEYITSTGRVVSETQTACALLLYFNLVTEEQKSRVVETLVENLKLHGNKITTGFVGTAYINHVLSENGYHELAGEIIMNEEYPGWLYAVNKGATTIWERWNSIAPDGSFDSSGMNSLNHYSYGSIGDWLYRKVAGINALSPGFKHILIRPMLTKGMEEVHAIRECPYGEIEVHTICKDGKIKMDVRIPVNTTADIYLPEQDTPQKVGSGMYSYEYDTETSLKIAKYNMNMKINELLEVPGADDIFNKYLPNVINGPMAEFVRMQTMNDMLKYDDKQKAVFEKILIELNNNTL